MTQLSLFQTASQSLLDSDKGVVSYEPDFLDGDTAARWFAYFRDHVAWQAHRRQLYDREVDVPRLRAAVTAGQSLSEPLHDALARVTLRVNAPFNSIGLNLYRDQNDSVAPHNDTLDALVPDQPIALLSLGATRSMTIREKAPPHGRLHVDMQAGSLMVMSWATQLHYDHGIGKERAPVGPRISLAFRVSQPGLPLDK
jgi:alkylated DNA repair dioxygenase AlkB